MASGKTVSVENLLALGAPRLAELLFEIASGDALAKRRLRLELASKSGGGDVSQQVRKRLATIDKSRSYVEWDKVKPLAKDLQLQLRAITDHVAPTNPKEALDLLWRFLAIAPSVYARCDDSNGSIGAVMTNACEALGPVALAAEIPAAALAQSVAVAVFDNSYGQHDSIIGVMKEQLGHSGLTALRNIIESTAKNPPAADPANARRVIGYGTSGPLYHDQYEILRFNRTVKTALQEIADALGDVDGFIASIGAEDRANPSNAAKIAERLIAAGRAGEALDILRNSQGNRRRGGLFQDWDRMHISALDATGDADAAQAERWSQFETSLNAACLRDYIKRLPDFDDMEAEERAIALATAFPDFDRGLLFLIQWPAPEAAGRMILARAAELDGNQYGLLPTAANEVEPFSPLASTLALRALIDFALADGRSKRYGYAADHLRQCARLASAIDDFGAYLNHDTYVAGLKARHGRKVAFWNG